MSGPWHEARRDVALSLAFEDRGKAQPVTVTHAGIEFPGEVVIAQEWDGSLGLPLTGDAMFRLVLQKSGEPPATGEVQDPRIGVVRATRNTHNRMAVTNVMEEAEAYHASARKPRRRPDETGLGAWTWGTWVFNDRVLPQGVSAVAGKPATTREWISAAGLMLLRRASFISKDAGTVGTPPAALWQQLAAGKSSEALGLMAAVLPLLNGDGPAVLGHIDRLLESHGGEALNTEICGLLMHQLGIPPVLAGVAIGAYIMERDAEAVLIVPRSEQVRGEEHADPPRLNRDMIPGERSIEDLLFRTASLRKRAGGWDSALPYLRLVLPSLRPSWDGGGSESDRSAFAQALERSAAGAGTAFDVYERLEKRLGAELKDGWAAKAAFSAGLEREMLLGVLRSGSVAAFESRAKSEFGSVHSLRTSIQAAQKLQRSAVDVIEIEECVAFLEKAEASRLPAHLAHEWSELRREVSLPALLEEPARWAPLQARFEAWRARQASVNADMLNPQ